ncbi:unnamed protein product [Wuchereria bancrofti]|uniref:Uncharacterized protein n=1 Tax=Wuchereria bancrofti TaxID=6293 RepID=A0A183XZ44_WUCBA|nr:unnamed protein product [Wuchereria bancrofti]
MLILVEAYDIEIRLKSDAEKPFQFHFSAGSVKRSQCDEKNWHFYVWELMKRSNLSSPMWKITDHKKFKMESLSLELFKLQPHVYITIKDGLKMSNVPMFGVLWCQHC